MLVLACEPPGDLTVSRLVESQFSEKTFLTLEMLVFLSTSVEEECLLITLKFITVSTLTGRTLEGKMTRRIYVQPVGVARKGYPRKEKKIDKDDIWFCVEEGGKVYFLLGASLT